MKRTYHGTECPDGPADQAQVLVATLGERLAWAASRNERHGFTLEANHQINLAKLLNRWLAH
jgi:hypothetical protein